MNIKRRVFIKQNLLYDIDGTEVDCPRSITGGVCRTSCAWYNEDYIIAKGEGVAGAYCSTIPLGIFCEPERKENG